MDVFWIYPTFFVIKAYIFAKNANNLFFLHKMRVAGILYTIILKT